LDLGALVGRSGGQAMFMALALLSSASAWRIEAMSISRPSGDTAPLPSFAACFIASTMRLALVTSASDGVNTLLASSTWLGWMAHLPSKPSTAARLAAARYAHGNEKSPNGPSIGRSP